MIARTNGLLRSHGRYDYSPIVARARFDWPGESIAALMEHGFIKHFRNWL